MATYIVWVGENEGNIVKADGIIVTKDDTVLFYVFPDGKIIKTYSLKEFTKYNPDWKLPENSK